VIAVAVRHQHLLQRRPVERRSYGLEMRRPPLTSPASIKVGTRPGMSQVQFPAPVIGPGLSAKIGIAFRRTP
jgi:hypothetical protein